MAVDNTQVVSTSDKIYQFTTICPGAIDTQLFELKPKLRKIAKTMGIMITPDLLAKRALKKMFRKRITYIPGVINKIALPLILILPVRVLAFFYGKMATCNVSSISKVF